MSSRFALIPLKDDDHHGCFEFQNRRFRTRNGCSSLEALFLKMFLFFALHFGAVQTYFSLFLKSYFNLNSLEMGLYMGIPILVTGPMCIFISRKTQKYKPRYILLFGLLVSGLGHILMTVKILELSFVFRIIHEIADTCTCLLYTSPSPRD